MLAEGFEWQIGNGMLVKFKEHKLDLEGLYGKSLLNNNIDERLSLVRDL